MRLTAEQISREEVQQLFIQEIKKREKELAEARPDAGTQPHRFYAILDAARDRRIYDFIRGVGTGYTCLYKKTVHYFGERLTSDLASAAPYLMEVSPEGETFKTIFLREAHVYHPLILSSHDLPITVFSHCSDLLIAADEDQKQMQFRYYDPRILSLYLPTCTEEELNIFYGPLKHLCVAGEDGMCTVYTRELGEAA